MSKLFKPHVLRDYLLPALGLMAVIGLIAFVNEKSAVRRCQGLVIDLSNSDDQFYLTAEDIEKHITQNGLKPLKGKLLADIDLAGLERKTREIKQIEFCEAYGDLTGTIHISAKPYVPYARVVSSTGASDCYLDEKGKYFPLSRYHSARVLLVSGSFFKKKPDMESEENADLLALIHTIKEDEFWNAQISEMEVAGDKSIRFIPVLGDQKIEFGLPENISEKLNKLKVFYKQIMPVKGWDQFSTVKVQYKNQVVCE
jgi:cell division protein FtsQ